MNLQESKQPKITQFKSKEKKKKKDNSEEYQELKKKYKKCQGKQRIQKNWKNSSTKMEKIQVNLQESKQVAITKNWKQYKWIYRI